jgi:hypothetical protein
VVEAPIDFQCFVARYALRRADELPEEARRDLDPPNVPHLVQIGGAKLIRPKREVMDMVVGLLLKTQMPKWQASRKRRAKKFGEINLREGADAAFKWNASEDADLDPDEFSSLEKKALLISRQIGMLRGGREIQTAFGYVRHESLLDWIWLAQVIQQMFGFRDLPTETDIEDVPFGNLTLFMSYKSDGSASLHVRPERTDTALIYHAAQMITTGAKLLTCAHCNIPFLGGGIGRGRNKKRADARFCSDKCRWGFHNQKSRKMGS